MDNQTKIDTLNIIKENLYFNETEYKGEFIHSTDLIDRIDIWLQELEQSNNKDNIDNWTNRELFDYCVENGLLEKNTENDFHIYWNTNTGKKTMINIISTFKSQK